MELTPFETPGEALAHRAESRGNAEALAFPLSGGRMTFAAWDAAATGLARGLLTLGIRPGEHVALLAENRVEWPLVQLAVARAGAVLVPLNTHYGRDDLAYALRQSDSRALILSRSFRRNHYLEMVNALRPELPRLEFVIPFDGAGDGCIPYEAVVERGRRVGAPLPAVRAGDVAALLYTSGTTGFPKGALISHGAMLIDAFGTARRIGIRAQDRWTSIIPLFHCAGCIMNLLGCLQTEACYVGVPAFDAETMFQVIEQERCTALSGVPTSYLAMLEHPARGNYDLSSLRTGTCGGAEANVAVLERCSREFPMPHLCQVYGQTESSTLISCPEAGDPERLKTAGPPLPGCEVRITDARTGEAVPSGRIGQIEARGPMVMDGYYKMPEATAETLDSAGWLRTGDLGLLTPEGRVVVAGGRLKDMIIRGGENVYPVEVEKVLATHPAVAEAAVFGLENRYYGEIVGAAVRLRREAGAAELRAFLDERVARFKVPAAFYVVEGFPQTASGKIQKVRLKEMAAAGALVRLE